MHLHSMPQLTTVMTFYHPSSDRYHRCTKHGTHSESTVVNTIGQEILNSRVRRAHLRATMTDNARSATVPKTFPKKRAATVTPLLSISSYSFKLVRSGFRQEKGNSCLGCSREISNIRKQVQNRANTKAERASDFKCPHRITDIVHYVVHVRPSRVSIQDFEHGGSVLSRPYQ